MDDLLSSLLILWGESVMPYPLPSSWALYAALSETPCPPTVTGLLVSSPFLEYQFHFLFPVKSKQTEYTLLSWYLKYKIHENLFAKMNRSIHSRWYMNIWTINRVKFLVPHLEALKYAYLESPLFTLVKEHQYTHLVGGHLHDVFAWLLGASPCTTRIILLLTVKCGVQVGWA